ncbi:MAG: DUF3887 domain-containing protein [Chloroflexi bacterium]|nr:DUF3887 domain-containing protein [Chloroflexota bacterium]
MKKLTLILLPIVVLAACSSKSVEIPENFQEISLPMAQNIFTSLEDDDYQTFQKDFDEKMTASIDESTFSSTQSMITERMGVFQNITYQQTTYEEGYLIAYYNLDFSEGDFTLRLVHEAQPPYKIAGFWFPDFPTE